MLLGVGTCDNIHHSMEQLVIEEGINSQDEMFVEITPSLAILGLMTTVERTT